MKKILVILIVCLLIAGVFVYAQKYNKIFFKKTSIPTFLILVSEQNITGPQKAWWVSLSQLSGVESKLAKALIDNNYKVLDPLELKNILKQNKTFGGVDISEDDSLKLARIKNADYVILGKAIASAGERILGSNMRSCFANIAVKIIRVKDAKTIANLDSSRSSPNANLSNGGKDALAKAADELSKKIINALVNK